MAKIVFDDGKEVVLSSDTVNRLKKELLPDRPAIELGTYTYHNDRVLIRLSDAAALNTEDALKGGHRCLAFDKKGCLASSWKDKNHAPDFYGPLGSL